MIPIDRKLVCALAASLAAPLAASAQQADGDDELFFDIPVVLSASRLEQPAPDSPQAVTIIDRELIEHSGARNIPEILRLVPGMTMARAVGEFGDEPQYVVAYHGHSDQYSRRMQVLIDGRSIYEPILGGVNWNSIPINIDDIERIEVIRGPNAASFGANSFLAVVNIITRLAIEDQGHYVKATAGNHEITDLTYRFGGSNGTDLDYRFTVTGQHDDGLDREDGLPNHDDLSASMLDYRIDYLLNTQNTITWQGGYGRSVQQVEQNFATLGIRPARDSDNINAYQFLKWENSSDTDNTYVVQYYLNYHDREDISTSKTFDPSALGLSADPFQLQLDFSLNSRRHNLEFTHFNNSLLDTRIIWGLSTQYDDISSPYFLGPGTQLDRKTYRAFINIEHHIGSHHLIQAGTLYESNEFDGDEFSPRFSYIYKPVPEHSFRYSISRAIRQPFIFESDANAFFTKNLTSGGTPIGFTLFYQQSLASPGLQTESIISRDVGYYGSFMEGDLKLSLRLFNESLSDLIDAATINNAPNDNTGIGTTTFTNQFSSDIEGIEFEFDSRLGRNSRLYGNFAYIEFDNTDSRIAKSAPRRSASLMGIFGLGAGFSLSTTVHYITDMSYLDVNNTTASGEDTGDYTILDVRLARDFRAGGKRMNLSLTARNLLDEYNAYDANPTNGPRLEENLTWYLELRVHSH